jgi:hypothetical protein
MSQMHTWHDFHLTGYAVDGKRQEIVFDLEWPYDSATDIVRARLRFTGVEGYFLEHDLGSNIVYSFEETPLRDLLQEWSERFDVSSKWGWPKFWRPAPYPARPLAEELEEAHQRLTAKGVKCIELSSSYGLSGWVLAVAVDHEDAVA